MKPKSRPKSNLYAKAASPKGHTIIKRMLRRKVLESRIKELEGQLRATNGETRKNMRNRLARVTGELAEIRTKLGTMVSLEENIRIKHVEIQRLRDKLKTANIDPDKEEVVVAEVKL